MAETKKKKYIIDNSALMAEWDWEKNNKIGLSPQSLTSGSNKKAWWLCSKNHSWQDTIGNRTNNRNCPYCSGHRVWVGFNDLATTHSNLCKEWDYDNNAGHSPTEFSKGSSFLASWICSNGHTYKATIANRTSLNRGCPYCAGRYVIRGKTDLLSINPKLAEEWDHDKNNIQPSEITANNPKKVWWKGKCGHSWQATVNSRNRGSGCPICAHVKLDNSNCLATVNPSLANKWHPTRNENLTPYDVFPNSSKKVTNLYHLSLIKIMVFRVHNVVRNSKHLFQNKQYSFTFPKNILMPLTDITIIVMNLMYIYHR